MSVASLRVCVRVYALTILNACYPMVLLKMLAIIICCRDFGSRGWQEPLGSPHNLLAMLPYFYLNELLVQSICIPLGVRYIVIPVETPLYTKNS